MESFFALVKTVEMSSISVMLPVCSSFSDILWAHIKSLIDQQVENEMCDSLLPQDYWNLRLSLDTIIESMSMIVTLIFN